MSRMQILVVGLAALDPPYFSAIDQDATAQPSAYPVFRYA